jgi:type III secretion protein W
MGNPAGAIGSVTRIAPAKEPFRALLLPVSGISPRPHRRAFGRLDGIMTLRIDNSSQQPTLASGQGGRAAPQDRDAGLWQGATVQVAADPFDLITDAAEEITFEHSERAEACKLEEREIEEPQQVDLPPIEKILSYLEATGKGDPDERLRRFIDAVRRNAEHKSDTGPREQARQEFGDVTEQFLALSFAAHELAREGSNDPLLQEVHTALEELNDDFGPQVRADLNTIDAAAQFGQGDAQRVGAFQASYRDAVLGGQDLAGMLKGALERFGESDYRGAVQQLIRALGDDLASMRGPSVQPTRLNAVLQDLYSMEVLATMLESCQRLAQKVGAQAGHAALEASNLLQDLVAASGERWSNPGRFSAIADKYGMAAPGQRVAFLTDVKALVREVPVKVFADADARFNVLNAAQGALDEAVATEEES